MSPGGLRVRRGEGTVRGGPGLREKVWDHAAGAIVVQEAGGVITDGVGNPLDFSNGRFLDIDIGIVATSTPALHATLLETIAKVR